MVVGRAGIFHSGMIMNETIQWPAGDFTLPQAFALNSAKPQAAVRKQLAADLAAKRMVQTKKGDGKIQGTFQVVKPA